jgi:heme exporter protein A
MTTAITVCAEGLRKVFDRRVIFDGITFSVASGQTLLISGRNGSGKSTLVKIVAGVLSPSGGTVKISGLVQGGDFSRQASLGMVSPYLQLYEEFSAEENLRHASAIRGMAYDRSHALGLLRRVGLFERKDDPVRAYSSGMKQRAKFAFALLHRPPLLLLDEPMANLDPDGIQMVRSLMEEHRGEGALIVATNDLSDAGRYEERVDLHG